MESYDEGGVYGAAFSATAQGFEAAAWDSVESQVTRFRVFHELCPLEGKTVLDVGCGRGDLAAYLVEAKVPFGSYVGIDVILPAILLAMGRGLPRSTFLQADGLEQDAVAIHAPDVVFLSGTLATLDHATARRLLENAWAGTRGALVFNFLSNRAAPSARSYEQLVRHDTLKWLEWALAKTSQVAFRQDYFDLGHDATILMRRP